MNREKINKFFGRLPTHAVILFTILVWVIPTFGLLVTSLRPVQNVNATGWWTAW